MTLVRNAYEDWLRVANEESTAGWAKTHHSALYAVWEARPDDLCLAVLPPRYESPVDVPFTCARSTEKGVYPSCRYFSHCWPELPAEPFQSSTSA
jgi:hypothetical protein